MSKLICMLILFPILLSSQSWITLSTDMSNDGPQSGYLDFVEISYSYDVSTDSLFLLFIVDENEVNFSPGWGIAIAIDTNLVLDDGTEEWKGANQSLSPDLVIDFLTNVGFPDFLPSNVTSISSDLDSMVLGFELEELDSDGRFNFVVGSAIFNFGDSGTVSDEVPDVGYLSMDLLSGIQIVESKPEVLLFPNPAFHEIEINAMISEATIISLDGKSTELVKVHNHKIDIGHLERGSYFLEFLRGSNLVHAKFVKL